MFQKFNTDTLAGKFIKSLLAQTPIPLFDAVKDGDNLIQGCYYVYKRFIIQCYSSGILNVPETEQGSLYPSDNLYPSIFLYPDKGYKVAKFYVRSYVDEEDIRTHSVYKSISNSYDTETHYHLGRYLRYLYATENLNLFPFYNCYSGKYFSDVELSKDTEGNITINSTDNQTSKVVAIPILFGKSYSIAIDCPTPVLVRACIHSNHKFTNEDNLPSGLRTILNSSGKEFTKMQFNTLSNFSIATAELKHLMLERNLYLLIQLPRENDSSIVVLENYNMNRNTIQCNEQNVIIPSLSQLSLLQMNTRESYAFSDRLLEYLLGNVIYKGDYVAQNIAKIQTALSKYYMPYKYRFLEGHYVKGFWDKDLTNVITNFAEAYESEHVLLDQDGNVNRDIEAILYSKGGNY